MSNPNPNVATRFAPGNPHGGRSKGARQRLSEKFQQTLADDFEQHGDGVIATVRTDDPSTYLGIVAKLQPREVEAKIQVQQVSGALSVDEHAAMRGVLDAIEAAKLGGADPAELFAGIEHYLRSEFARPVQAIEHAPAAKMPDLAIDASATRAAMPAPPY